MAVARLFVLFFTLTAAALAQSASLSSCSAASTTTETAILTVTRTETSTLVLTTTSASFPASTGPFYYYVDNGTTIWVGGRQPSSVRAKPSPSSISTVTVFAASTLPSCLTTVLTKIYLTITETAAPPTASAELTTTIHLNSTLTIHRTITSTIQTKARTGYPSLNTTAPPLHASGDKTNVSTSCSTLLAASSELSATSSLSSASLTHTTVHIHITSTIYVTESAPASSEQTLAKKSSTVSLSSSAISSNAPTPSTCGESGNFTLGWDDEPSFNPADNDTAPYPPVFNPYHHFFFSNGYAYIPPPNDPYPPISPPRLAIFLPNASSQDIGSPSAAGERPGEIGAGPRASSSAFWFNAYGAYLGCNNTGPNDCTVLVSGFLWNGTAEILEFQQHLTIPPCPGFSDCHLIQSDFNLLPSGLSGLQIRASIIGEESIPVAFYMDNLSMGWYNNSCAAGLLRQMSRKR